MTENWGFIWMIAHLSLSTGSMQRSRDVQVRGFGMAFVPGSQAERQVRTILAVKWKRH